MIDALIIAGTIIVLGVLAVGGFVLCSDRYKDRNVGFPASRNKR
jgi:hypothetical protein